jgi:hypothetical protein
MHLHDGDVAVVLAALHIEDGSISVHPQPRDIQPRAHKPAWVVPQVQDEALSPIALHMCMRHMSHWRTSSACMRKASGHMILHACSPESSHAGLIGLHDGHRQLILS